MFVLYGLSRFFIELLRSDNPFEFAGLTISQLIGLGMIALGLTLMAVFQTRRSSVRDK
jgi:prolipoprotein diacylglyceryltransferase